MRPSLFIASTQRITIGNIGAYILDMAGKGKTLDAAVVCPIALGRWLAQRDIPKIEEIVTTADFATESEPKILAAEKPHDSHVKDYYSFRLTVADSRRAGPPLGDVNKMRADPIAEAQSRAEWARRDAEIAAKKANRAPAKPRSEKSATNQAMVEMLQKVAKGGKFDGLWVAARAKQLLAE